MSKPREGYVCPDCGVREWLIPSDGWPCPSCFEGVNYRDADMVDDLARSHRMRHVQPLDSELLADAVVEEPESEPY